MEGSEDTEGVEAPTQAEEKIQSVNETEKGKSLEEDPAVLEWKLPQVKSESQQDKLQMGDLNQALPQPILYHEILWRDWQDLYDLATLTDKQFDFTVLSYNILSQDLIGQNPHLYLHCPPSTLHWDYRWPNILQELQHWEADILCLQEVQEDHYRDQIKPSLTALGYSCHYKRRTGRKTDGCATCYKTQRFTLMQESHVEFFRPGIDVLNRDNVGLILVLQPIIAEDAEDAQTPPPLCIANTHLLYNPRRGDIKLAQLAVLLAEVEKLSCVPDGSRCPIVLCGDLNATPKSPLYQLLYNGVLNCSGMPAWKVSGQEQFCSLPLPRALPHPLWPDILGINDRCQYVSRSPPKVKDRKIYTRQRLLELRYCEYALQRPPDLLPIKGVTDRTPDSESTAAQAGIFPDPPASLFRTPHLLQHHLQLTSAYTHFLPAKGRHEVTTFPLGIGSTVDYIFYSAEPVPICSTNHGLRLFQDGKLKLLGRLSLLCEDDLWAAQGLPNPFCCSDHLCLLVRFSLDLSSPQPSSEK
ncbi:protein angel homolog 1 [Hyperolius riggenbachi]|uniref:protein angel homolog 1 n=1 Tax=Hyperolius riggenbachi TaxID=752182 RepID=UPI0035A27192